MKTVWVANEFGNLTFKHGKWTLTRWAHESNEIDASHDGDNISLDVYEDHIRVFGEESRGYSVSAVPVTIPFAVLRAVLEVYDSVPTHTV